MLGEFVCSRQVADLAEQAQRRKERWIHFDAGDLRAGYDRKPFLIRHVLHERREFQLEPLIALCRRRPDLAALRQGKVPVQEDFARSFDHYPASCTLDEALDDLQGRQAYVVITNAERDAEYRIVLQEMLGEIALATAALDPGITWYSTYIFLSSRGSLTPYHMDREMNFLLQIRGDKCVRLWDPRDDEVMTPAQKDELLAYGSPDRPPFRESFAHKAQRFDLHAGLGLHHPFIAPHLVETSSGLSISLAFTYRTRRTDRLTNAHQWNHKMRKAGMRPMAVGADGALDHMKSVAIQAARLAKRVLRPSARDGKASGEREAGAGP